MSNRTRVLAARRRCGGVIAIDNVLWSGRVVDPTVNDSSTVALRAFNKKLRDDKRIVPSLIPIGGWFDAGAQALSIGC